MEALQSPSLARGITGESLGTHLYFITFHHLVSKHLIRREHYNEKVSVQIVLEETFSLLLISLVPSPLGLSFSLTSLSCYYSLYHQYQSPPPSNPLATTPISVEEAVDTCGNDKLLPVRSNSTGSGGAANFSIKPAVIALNFVCHNTRGKWQPALLGQLSAFIQHYILHQNKEEKRKKSSILSRNF